MPPGGKAWAGRRGAAAAASAAASAAALEVESLLPGKGSPSRPTTTDSFKTPGSKQARPGRQAWALFLLCAAVYVTAYSVSLTGGSHPRDLAFINAHLNIIGRSIVVSIGAFTAALWAARWLGRAAWPARAALVGVHLVLLAADTGGDFQHHGRYNWMLFLIICTPLNLALLGLFFWYTSMKPRAFLASLAASIVTLTLVVSLALVHYQHLAHRGFFGRSLIPGCDGRGCPRGSEPNCNFADTTPWIDLLPKGAQNFWTGSQHCKPVRGFEATFSAEGLLTISGCPQGAERQFTPFPSTRLWGTEQKTHERAAYQTNVLKSLKAEPYSRPVMLEGTEAVLARCGDAERLLTRVERRAKRPPPEPPLAAPRSAAAAPAKGEAERLNVLVLFIDSLGRRHFFRRMPRTAAALEALGHRDASLRLHQFFRYHVTGMQTDPNTHVMYTGSPFDDPPHAQPFWHAYRRAGYVSGSVYNLCEDWGTEYDRMPTPHDHELVAPFCDPEYHPVTPDGEPYQIFKGAFSILRRCLRGRHVHQYNLDWSNQFMDAYDGVAPWLLISSFHEAHEGTGEVIATADGDLAEFLLQQPRARLNSTAVILVADHGATMGLNYMYTSNGRITEHKIPVLAMLLPSWLEQKYPAAAAALAANEQRLVSGYDFHTTLHHLLHLGESAAPPAEQYAAWARAGNVTEKVRWGVSLLDKVPAGRTCDQAGIPPEWCGCFAP